MHVDSVCTPNFARYFEPIIKVVCLYGELNIVRVFLFFLRRLAALSTMLTSWYTKEHQTISISLPSETHIVQAPRLYKRIECRLL